MDKQDKPKKPPTLYTQLQAARKRYTMSHNMYASKQHLGWKMIPVKGLRCASTGQPVTVAEEESRLFVSVIDEQQFEITTVNVDELLRRLYKQDPDLLANLVARLLLRLT